MKIDKKYDPTFDAVLECTKATVYWSSAALFPAGAGVTGYLAVTSSATCLAKTLTLLSGATYNQYQQLSNGLKLFDPIQLAATIFSGGEIVGDSKTVDALSFTNGVLTNSAKNSKEKFPLWIDSVRITVEPFDMSSETDSFDTILKDYNENSGKSSESDSTTNDSSYDELMMKFAPYEPF